MATSTTLLDQIIEPFADCLTPEAARKIVSLRADAATQSRVDALADKANEGILTESERAEYDRALAAYDVITIMQVRARRMLGRPAAG